MIHFRLNFPGGLDGKASVYNVGDLGSIPGSGDPLEKEMAIHSSTIAWKIPWTEERGRLQSMGSQSRTRLSDVTFTAEAGLQGYVLGQVLHTWDGLSALSLLNH